MGDRRLACLIVLGACQTTPPSTSGDVDDNPCQGLEPATPEDALARIGATEAEVLAAVTTGVTAVDASGGSHELSWTHEVTAREARWTRTGVDATPCTPQLDLTLTWTLTGPDWSLGSERSRVSALAASDVQLHLEHPIDLSAWRDVTAEDRSALGLSDDIVDVQIFNHGSLEDPSAFGAVRITTAQDFETGGLEGTTRDWLAWPEWRD